MAKKDENKLTSTEKFAQKTNLWIGDHAKVLIGVGVAVIIALIALIIVFAVIGNRNDRRFDDLVALESSYSNIDEIGDEQFITEAEAVVSDAGLKSYPGAKAALLIADVSYDNEDYDLALDWYSQVATAQADTYLYQVATINQAACYEMLGNNTEALNLYIALWDSFGVEGIYGSRVLFNTARLYEAEGNVELAMATYEQLVGEYSDAQREYAALATTRLAQLN